MTNRELSQVIRKDLKAKEYTRQKLAPYYSNERIENVVKHYVSVVRPGVVLVENKNVGLMELYL